MQGQVKNKTIEPVKPLDYLVVGHLTEDLMHQGSLLGGTAAFSGLTAKALGLETGIITSCKADLDTSALDSLWISKKIAQHSTTFKNISDGIHRKQYLYTIADELSKEDLSGYKSAPAILHLGPVANEVDPEILDLFKQSLKCLTPQGWFRRRNQEHLVELHPWEGWEIHLPKADAAVISIEDVKKDEDAISRMALNVPVFAVTENYLGARVYWHNDVRFFSAPEVKYLDDTGAGDIFAAAFFYRYFQTKDPWEAGRFAVLLASWSVTRQHLDSIPTSEEINRAKLELLSR
jgi:sugar/nucleoside kinase (ribokinase family)